MKKLRKKAKIFRYFYINVVETFCVKNMATLRIYYHYFEATFDNDSISRIIFAFDPQSNAEKK